MLLQFSWPYIHHWVGVKRPELLVEVILFLSLLDTCILYVFCFVRFFSLRLWETYSGHLHEKNIKLNIRKNLWPTPCFCYYIMNVDSDCVFIEDTVFYRRELFEEKRINNLLWHARYTFVLQPMAAPRCCSSPRPSTRIQVYRLSSPPYPVLAHR